MPRFLLRSIARTGAGPLALLLGLALGVASPSDADAQVPEEFTNLQVLPQDIDRGRMMDIMRSFSAATGMRCSSCHVGEEGSPLSTYDFASDDRAGKRKAREMMRMVGAINDTYLAALPDRRGPAVRVTCQTCHAGVRRPEAIESIVSRLVEEEGVDAAIERYRALRERYYGSAAYDFRDGPLVRVAEGLMRAENNEAARGILELGLELDPESALTTFGLARLHDTAGNTAEAIRFYERTLELTPDNRRARARLEQLRGGGAS